LDPKHDKVQEPHNLYSLQYTLWRV